MIRVLVDYNTSEDQNVVAITRPSEIPAEELKVGNRIITYSEDLECEAILRHGKAFEWVADMVLETAIHPFAIEADARLNKEQLQQALIVSGITEITPAEDGLSGRSPASGLTFKSWDKLKDAKLVSTLKGELSFVSEWHVATRITFRCPATHGNLYRQELRSLVENLAKLSDACFALYEDSEYSFVTVIHDSNGLKFVERFWPKV